MKLWLKLKRKVGVVRACVSYWADEASIIQIEGPKAAVPNIFGITDWFRGRWGAGGEGKAGGAQVSFTPLLCLGWGKQEEELRRVFLAS